MAFNDNSTGRRPSRGYGVPVQGARYQPGTTAPRDRVIEVRTIDDGRWGRVKWNRAFRRFLVIDGDGCWVWEAEVEVWRDAAQPSIGSGTPLDERNGH